jgi:hypothetical protein
MQKNVQDAMGILKSLKSGVHTHDKQWTGLPVSETQLQTAIDELQAAGDAIDQAESVLKQARLAARTKIELHNKLANQTISLAEGLHANEEGKLADYGLSTNAAARAAKAVPTKAIIESLIDDYDGIGFIIKVQSIADAEGYEIEKSQGIDSALTVLAPPYTHLRNIIKITYTDDDVEKGKRYFYRVRGYNRRGYGEWSEPVSRVQ